MPAVCEALALTHLRRGQHRRLGRERMGQPAPGSDARRDSHGPVDPGRDQAVDPLRFDEPVDSLLVLGGDDRAAVGVAEAGRVGIAVDGDHVQVALAGRGEQPELRRPRA